MAAQALIDVMMAAGARCCFHSLGARAFDPHSLLHHHRHRFKCKCNSVYHANIHTTRTTKL
jgi:exoribonuclease II